MKKSLLPMLLASSLLLGTVVTTYPIPTTAYAEEHKHEENHEHVFEFDATQVVKKDGDHYIMAHGDHYHTIPASDLTAEEIAAADKNIADHPELAKEYDEKKNIYAGYFEDEQVKDRELSDWNGEWQSVLPYLEDGTLDPVMEKKAAAEGATMTAEEYKEYYTVGYATDVTNINIKDDKMTFIKADGSQATGTYKYEGYKILQYKKGNRGVRFLFTKVDGDEAAPKSIQFSDHNIAPTPGLSHYHIYMSDVEHDVLLEEMENWPTYYPTEWNSGEILSDQLNH